MKKSKVDLREEDDKNKERWLWFPKEESESVMKGLEQGTEPSKLMPQVTWRLRYVWFNLFNRVELEENSIWNRRNLFLIWKIKKQQKIIS